MIALFATTDESIGGSFNIGTGIETSVLRLVELLQKHAGERAWLSPFVSQPGQLSGRIETVQAAHELIDHVSRTLQHDPAGTVGSDRQTIAHRDARLVQHPHRDCRLMLA